MKRRTFLRAAGGTMVALPLLPSLIAKGDPSIPKRFVVFFSANGVIHSSWFPTDGTTEEDFTLAESFAPLAHRRDDLVITKGIDMPAVDAGPGEPHQAGMGGVLTGRPLLEGDMVGGDGTLAGWGGGESIDQRIARAVSTTTALRSLELGVRASHDAGSEVRSRMSYRGASLPLPPIEDPVQTFDQLFSDAGVPLSELQRIRDQRRSVLDGVGEQLRQVMSQAGSEDRVVLERHAEHVRELEQRLSRMVYASDACVIPEMPPSQEVDHENTMVSITELQADLLVHALACDLTRVGSLQISNARNHIRFPWVGSLGDGHQLSHASGTTAGREEWILRDTWHATVFARMLDGLAAIPEGDGTMLDNTLALWVTDVSKGNTHTHRDMPFVLAGGAGGAIRTGRYIRFPHVSHCDLLTSILRAFDIEDELFGDPAHSRGPLSGL